MSQEQAPGRTLLSQLVPVAALAGALVVLGRAQETISLVLLAVLTSYLIRSLLDFLPKRMSRGVAVALVLLFLVVVAAGFAAWIVPQLLQEAGDLAHNFPKISSQALHQLRTFRASLTRLFPSSWLDSLDTQLGELGSQAGSLGVGAATKILAGVPQILGLLIVPVLAFYFAKDGKEIWEWLSFWVPRRRKELVQDLADSVDRTMTGYIRGQSLVCLVQAVECTIAFTLVGLPYAALLGTLAGIAETLPFVGSTVVMVLIAVVALPVGGILWLKGLAAYVILNQILNFLIIPRIMKSQIEIHPLATLLAVGAGAEIAGFYGVLFALPATAAVMAVLRVLRERRSA